MAHTGTIAIFDYDDIDQIKTVIPLASGQVVHLRDKFATLPKLNMNTDTNTSTNISILKRTRKPKTKSKTDHNIKTGKVKKHTDNDDDSKCCAIQ